MKRNFINRDKVVAQLNEMILAAKNPEMRTIIHNVGSALLMAANSYKGFGYIGWLEGGYDLWVAAGKPKDTMQFCGDKTVTRLY